MPPAYVKPYVKRQKETMRPDAEGICEAVPGRTLRFRTTKTASRQSGLVLANRRPPSVHSVKKDLGDQCNPGPSCRFGIVAPVGRHGVEELLNVVTDPNDMRVPGHSSCMSLGTRDQLQRIKEQILEFDRLIRAWHRSNEMSMRLEEAPGVGQCWPLLWSLRC